MLLYSYQKRIFHLPQNSITRQLRLKRFWRARWGAEAWEGPFLGNITAVTLQSLYGCLPEFQLKICLVHWRTELAEAEEIVYKDLLLDSLTITQILWEFSTVGLKNHDCYILAWGMWKARYEEIMQNQDDQYRNKQKQMWWSFSYLSQLRGFIYL